MRRPKTNYNPPITLTIYLGSGKNGIKLRDNLSKKCPRGESIARYILSLVKKAEPSLFEGLTHGYYQ